MPNDRNDSKSEAPAGDFSWQPQPLVAKWLNSLLDDFCEANPDIAWMAERMRMDTGTRLVDWVDHLGLFPSAAERAQLQELGYQSDRTCDAGDDGTEVLVHRQGLFPPILLLSETSNDDPEKTLIPVVRLGIRVDSVADFIEANRLDCLALDEGTTDGQFRHACISQVGGVALYVVERHGWSHFSRPQDRTEQIAAGMHHLREFRKRSRNICLLYTSPSPRDATLSRMPSSA